MFKKSFKNVLTKKFENDIVLINEKVQIFNYFYMGPTIISPEMTDNYIMGPIDEGPKK